MEVSQSVPAGGRKLRPHSQCWDQRGEARWDSKGHTVFAQRERDLPQAQNQVMFHVMQKNYPYCVFLGTPTVQSTRIILTKI